MTLTHIAPYTLLLESSDEPVNSLFDNNLLGKFFSGINAQKAMLDQAKDLGHTFYWCEDHKLNDSKVTKVYNSAYNIPQFLIYYNSIPSDQKHCYEITKDPFYLYFDLDFKPSINIPADEFNDTSLFLWFDQIFKEFITFCFKEGEICFSNIIEPSTNILANDPDYTSRINILFNLSSLSHTDWVVTSASNNEKLSLHLINRNVIFRDRTLFKEFYDSFNSFLISFSNHPFNSSFDKAVCSNFRAMRLTGSTKLGNNRVLKVSSDVHPLGIKLQHTFISDAINDPKINEKTFTQQHADYLFLYKHKNEVSTQDEQQLKQKSNNLIEFIAADNPDEALEELLQLLSIERWDNYHDWLCIAYILKSQPTESFFLFDKFSQLSSKYNANDCLSFWDNLNLKERNKPLTLATLHFFAKSDNPNAYKLYLAKHIKVKIDLPFTSDKIINEQYIPPHIYSNGFDSFDIIALKSAMKTGKTYALPITFGPPSKDNKFHCIIVVYFRISLSKELIAKWKHLGFILYSDIQGPIDTKKYPRIIVQIDSIHRIQGKSDLLILDEIESTFSHLCSSKNLDQQKCFNTLRNYITKTPKVLMADANLTDATVNLFSGKRNKCIKILNEYKSFDKVNAQIIHTKAALFKSIYDQLDNNKRIVIPTNSKTFSKKIYKLITEKYPDKKVLLINKDTDKDHKIEVAEWINYDILIFTPTILAGVSFDPQHYHVCCAYLSNKSCNAEMSSQMLFRIRNLIDNKMFIYTPNNFKNSVLPISNTDIEIHLNNKMRLGHLHNESNGLQIDAFEQRVVKTQYFKIYREFVKRNNISTMYFATYLKHILEFHGVNISETVIKVPLITSVELNRDFKEAGVKIKVEEAQALIDSENISVSQYIKLLDSKTEKTTDQRLSMGKHKLLTVFNRPWNDTLQKDTDLYWVTKNIEHVDAYKNYKSLKDKTIDEGVEECSMNHEIQYDSESLLNARQYDDGKWSSDSEFDAGSELDENLGLADSTKIQESRNTIKERKVLQKRSIKKTVVHSLHYNRRWLRLIVCLEFLRAAGFENVNDEKKIKLNWEGMIQYCKANEERIRGLFDSIQMYWKDEVDAKQKMGIMKYVNSKLESMLGINIRPTNNSRINYEIKPLFELEDESLII
jgi:hypothetical protein